ncbi:MDR family MFS transporter [Promethearchaeum syntrophicum]|uniref:MDR family MFS transporter n=1 Tax=Promethearchaeum syntrophicum TaxID=2594042 RepID=A0A5B9DEM4_9ARCH|nr:MFS transporter [Candidatus Prometheoarchaeum syntrophicum]QEE17297.1 multidrug resistance protein MdtH [Candidatus Prometheoarchaeum syntrophicum]
MFTKAKKTYKEFPDTFWVITLGSFIDQIGGFMLMPFISFYMTSTFGIGMIEAGIVFLIVGLGSLVGGIIGGALTDKFGRKSMALYGLLMSGLFSLILIFINNLTTLYIVVGLMGLVGSLGGPARGAMIADVLPPEQRAEGYGILRVAINLSATIGPALGGFLLGQGFMWIFIGDAVTSAITAVIFYIKVPETKPIKKIEDTDIPAKPETVGQSMGGYKDVFKDWKFMFFIGISMIMTLVYMNMNFTLPVFLIDDLSFSPQIYGWLISMNAFMVVVLQFYITRKVKKFPALIVIAIGNLLYGIGFAMYGFISSLAFVFIAMIIITIGEMIIAPFSEAIAATFAPEDKRGRYLAVYGWSGLFPMMLGNIAFGAVMDKLDSIWVWYICGILSIFAVGGYLLLNKLAKGRFNEGSSTDVEEVDETEVLSESGSQILKKAI